VKINGATHCLWRAVDREGKVLEADVSRSGDRKAALKFLRKTPKRHGPPHVFVTDKLRTCGAARKNPGLPAAREAGQWPNYRAENSHQPTRRRERAMLRFRRMRSSQKCATVHSSVRNPFHAERTLSGRDNLKAFRTAALIECRQPGAA
jgi:putative transposase